MKNLYRLLEQADITLNLICSLILKPKLCTYSQLNGILYYNITPMPPPRHRNPSAPQTAQQGHLGTTRPRRMACTPVNTTLFISYILHTQDSFGTSLWHNRTITSAEEIPKTFPSDSVIHAEVEIKEALQKPAPYGPIPQLGERNRH